MTTVEAKQMVENDHDFIYLKRFQYSLTKLLERYPDGVPDRIIANGLMLTEDDVHELYERTVKKLRGLMGVE